MKKIIVITLLLALLLPISLKNLTIGGDKLYAATYKEQNMYEVTIENNLSKVVTTMTVMALSEQEAYNNIALNGWTVLSVKLIEEGEKAPAYHLSTDYIKTEIPNQIVLEGSIDDMPSASSAKETSSSSPVISMDNGNSNVSDNLNLLPTSDDLELVFTIHFNLGEVEPIYNDDINRIFDNLSIGEDYVLFGNADDISVGINAPYKDNYELSYLRAEFIKKLLMEKGFNGDNIRTIGLGTSYPLEKTGEKGSLKNRRVEIYKFKVSK